MSVRLSTSLVAAVLVCGSTLSSIAGDGGMSPAPAGTRPEAAVRDSTVPAPPRQADAAAQIANLFRQAPAGHRKPRVIDSPERARNSSLHPESLWADDEINPRLVICRGC